MARKNDSEPRLSKRQKLIKFYTEVGEQILSNGAYDAFMNKTSQHMYIGYRKAITRNSEKVIYTVRQLPNYLDREVFAVMRQIVENYGVVLNFSMRISPHKIDWTSPKMKENKKLLKDYMEAHKYDTLDHFSTLQERRSMDEKTRAAETFGYYTSIEEKSQELCKVDIMIELCKIKFDDKAIIAFRNAQKKFLNFCAIKGIVVEPVKFNLFDYFKTRSPLVCFRHEVLEIESRALLSDEIIARLPGYTGGTIGKLGILMGRDITTNKLVYKNFVSKTGSAENMIVVAETGGGKSFYVKSFLTMSIANGFNIVILDIDGEYEPLAHEVDGTVVSFDKSYFDTTEISEPTGDPRVDDGLLNESRQATTTVFACLTSIDNGMSPVERKIFTEAYNKMYLDNNVLIDDQSTWGNSKDLSYHKLYDCIKEFMPEEEARKINVSAKDVQTFVAKLSTFFEPSGLYSFLFTNKISVNEVFDRKSKEPMFVDIVLNLQKNATKGEELIVQTVKQLTANYLTTLIANRNKLNHQFTMEVIEEYQRYAGQPDVSDMILTKITGNRKRNMNTVLITNSPLQLLKSGTSSAYAVIENLNNFVVGALKPKTIEMVCEVFNLDNCESLLTSIASNNMYKHVFMLKLNNREVVPVKWEIPPSLLNNPMFLTRDVQMAENDTISSMSWEDFKSEVRQKKEEGHKILTGRKTS